ncbi:MAG TPA: DNA primase [Candidatus Parcubacteria bacterium]|nr:DNA primase [Candidatus Parcubacteria bacterium]|tara:strand:+ start:34400 stop:36118 length:1719 start_codon:yes stop_codon:yes gene_type:complete
MISSPIDEIKNRLDVVEVIQQYIRLQKAGANFRAVCPFHSEKKPSFFVSPVRQIWHCFGCGKGGDIFAFVREIEGIEFGDALRVLAQKAGIELKKQDPKLRTQRERLYEISELSTRFFEKQLKESQAGNKVKEYLLNRGISEESIKKWRLGYAPDSWQGLSDFLVGKGYKREEIEKAGLAIKKSADNYFDRFRGRIMFPVFDLNSQVIGFGGRIFDTEKTKKIEIAKYVNTPATFLYDKGRILYGLDRTRVEIRKKDFCLLVEGYIDVIMSWQAGLKNVVATSGTALTPNQLNLLRRYSSNLFTAFDMDIAGDMATKRGIDLAQNAGFNIKVITMPEGKDPADVILENPKNWEELVAKARSIIEFYFETTFSKFDSKKPEGKREISKLLLPLIKRIPNRIEQSHWIQELAKRLEVREGIVEDEMKNVKKGLVMENTEEADSIIIVPRQRLLEDTAASLVCKNPESSLHLITDEYLPYFRSEVQTIFINLRQGRILETSYLSDYLFLKAEVEEEVDSKTEIQTCLMEMKNLDTKNKLDGISQEIKEAEEKKDIKKIDNLIEKFKKLAGQLSDN